VYACLTALFDTLVSAGPHVLACDVKSIDARS
jgi:hypothetical protein